MDRVTQKSVHLLTDYGLAATTTLCGLQVPDTWDSVALDAEPEIFWSWSGQETCERCKRTAILPWREAA